MARAAAAVARGRLELARGQPHGALDALVEAADCWRALDVPYELATTRTLMGEALRATGDDGGAATAFAEAARLFEQIGARVDAARAAGEDAPSTLPDGLTNREVEVLRLIAAGHSNSAIASALFLSPKTVSRHLSNIFTKIGVSSRAAATAFAFEQHLITDSGSTPR
jgi:DNA-binding CsgD family transcriptional regulator